MSKYMIRVELHRASPSDYEILHAAMEAGGFSRTIRNADGVTYRLPTAEYIAVSALTVDQLRALAAQAAWQTGTTASVVVVEYNAVAWSGLDRVR
jgi:Endoribonuclease GhoS